MKLSLLARLLVRDALPREVSETLANELQEHLKGLEVRGGVAPVYVSEDADVVLDERGVATLCELFLSGDLSPAELAYLADVLQLSERVDFSSPWVADAISLFTDPEINGPMTVSRAEQLLAGAG